MYIRWYYNFNYRVKSSVSKIFNRHNFTIARRRSLGTPWNL